MTDKLTPEQLALFNAVDTNRNGEIGMRELLAFKDKAEGKLSEKEIDEIEKASSGYVAFGSIDHKDFAEIAANLKDKGFVITQERLNLLNIKVEAVAGVNNPSQAKSTSERGA